MNTLYIVLFIISLTIALLFIFFKSSSDTQTGVIGDVTYTVNNTNRDLQHTIGYVLLAPALVFLFLGLKY